MTKLTRLKFNALAPNLELQSDSGQLVCLERLWSEQTLLLAFIRHFGCPQCKELLAELRQFRPELEKAGLRLAVITQGNPEETLAFCEEFAPGFLCLSDPDRRAYQAYGIERGALSQTLLSPRVWKANQRVRHQHGWKAELPPVGQDAFQMSAIFIIGTDGRVRLPYYYDDIADHPPLALLLKGVLGTDWNKPFEGPLSAK